MIAELDTVWAEILLCVGIPVGLTGIPRHLILAAAAASEAAAARGGRLDVMITAHDSSL